MKNMNLHKLEKDPRWHWWICDGCNGFKNEKTPVGSPTTLKDTPTPQVLDPVGAIGEDYIKKNPLDMEFE